MTGLDSSLGTSTHAKGKKRLLPVGRVVPREVPHRDGQTYSPSFHPGKFLPRKLGTKCRRWPPAAGEQQSPSSAVGYSGGWGPFAICSVNPIEMEQRFWSSIAQQQKAKGCQVLCSQLCWLMLPSGGETPPKTSEVFVADLSESDLL